MMKRHFLNEVTDLARKKAGKIGRGLLWLAAVVLLLAGVLFFVFTALVHQGQLPFGYQITLIQQSSCDIPLTDTLVLTRQQDSYAPGDSVVFYRQRESSAQPDCGTLQNLDEGLGVTDQSGAVALLTSESVTGKILLCFPTLGKLATWVNGPAQSSLLFWGGILLGVVLLSLAALLMVSAFRAKRPTPLPARSSQAAYQPETELSPVKLFSLDTEELSPPSQPQSSPEDGHYPSPEELEALPWRKYAVQEEVPLHKETPAEK